MTELDCIYIASRRGYKGPRKPNNKRLRSTSPSPSSTLSSIMPVSVSMPVQPPESCPMLLGAPRTTVTMPSELAVVTSSFAQAVGVNTPIGGTTGIGSVPSNYATVTPIATLPPGTINFNGAPIGPVGPAGTTAEETVSVAAVSAAAVAAASLAAAPVPPPSSHLNLYRHPFSNAFSDMTANGNMALAMSAPPVPTIADRCFDAFYQFFFDGHPFVLPKDIMVSLIKDSSVNISHLLAAMQYVGSLYIDAGPSRAMFLDEALRLVYLPTCPKDGYQVQAMIMLIIGLDGSCEQERARQVLADCERIAVDIGLNQRVYASANGRGNPIIEESWRRTWWDLFVVDGMVAGVHRMTNFLLYDVPTDVALPCEEEQYQKGVS